MWWLSLGWLTGLAALAQPLPDDATATAEASSPSVEVTAPPRYTLAADESLLGVVVYYKRGGLLSSFAHDHVLTASQFEGTVDWDPQDVSRCKIAIAFPLSALVVDPGRTRSIVGIDPDDTVGAGSKQQILDNAFSEKQLHASKYPNVRFDSTACAPTEDGAEVRGTLAIRGLSVDVRVRANVSADGETFRAKGRFDLKHATLGFRPYSNGLLSNDDPLRFVFDLKGSASPAP